MTEAIPPPDDPFEDELPGSWRAIEPAYPDFQLGVARNDDSEEVIAAEKAPDHAPHHRGDGFQAVLLPEHYNENPEVIEVLTKNTTREEAVQIARLYMEGNP